MDSNMLNYMATVSAKVRFFSYRHCPLRSTRHVLYTMFFCNSCHNRILVLSQKNRPIYVSSEINWNLWFEEGHVPNSIVSVYPHYFPSILALWNMHNISLKFPMFLGKLRLAGNAGSWTPISVFHFAYDFLFFRAIVRCYTITSIHF